MTDASLNADFNRPAVLHTAVVDWQASPSPTVWRKRLDLSGPKEAGRVTSVVRYDSKSAFPEHPHPDGEEYLVLDGVFSDEHGDYPAGTYVLNPEGVSHAPYSRDGCVLFVKLRQYPGAGRKRIVVDTDGETWRPGQTPGVTVLPLYEEAGYPEKTSMLRMAAGAVVADHACIGGEEFFVVDGSVEDANGHYVTGSWARFPDGSRHYLRSETGCTLYLKRGHLAR